MAVEVEDIVIPGTEDILHLPWTINDFGPSGSMKSTFAFTWPKPMSIWDFDFGAHRAHGVGYRNGLWTYYGDPELIKVHRPVLPNRSLTERYAKLKGFITFWDKFCEDFNADCEDSSIQTIVIDTGTVLWAIACDAYLEEIQQDAPNRKQLIQIEYGEPNRRLTTLFQQARSYQKNLIMVHHEAPEYQPYVVMGRQQVDNQGNPMSIQTGRMIPDGWKVERLLPKLDWDFYIQPEEPGSKVIKAEIRKSALGVELVGNTFGGGTEEEPIYPTYQTFMGMLKVLGKV